MPRECQGPVFIAAWLLFSRLFMAPRLGALLTAPSSRPWTGTMPQAQVRRGRSRASSSSRVSPGPKSQAQVPQMPRCPATRYAGLCWSTSKSCKPQAWVRPSCAFLSIHYHLELSQWHWPHDAGSSLNLALPAPLHPPCHSSSGKSGYCATHSPHVTQPTKKTCKQPDTASSPLHAFKTTWCPTRIS